jgi:ketosteroid isomerase-like protein
MSQKNVEIVKRMNALLDSGDIEEALACCDANVEWANVSPEPGPAGVARRLQGIPELRSVLAAWEELLRSPFAAEIQHCDYIDAGDCVVSVTHSRSLGFDLHAASIYEFDGGKVLRIRQGYPDKSTALAAARLAE